MKALLIASFWFLLSLSLNAQNEFKPGWVMLSPTDTLFGKIDNKGYYQNAQFCDFLASGTDTVVRFYPEEILGYHFSDGKQYVAKKTDLGYLFLEYLVDGELDLYFYLDKKDKTHYYAATDSSELLKLEY